MTITYVTPTLPWKLVSSDTETQSVSPQSPEDETIGDNANFAIQYFHVAVDSANRIFIRFPSTVVDAQYVYQWFALDNTAANYPAGTIEDINCSYTYDSITNIIHLIVLANNIVYQFTALHSMPGVGTPTYGWQIITPVGAQPTFNQN